MAAESFPAYARNGASTPPPPKTADSEANEHLFRSPGGSQFDVYFNRPRLSRANSIVTLSRASFSHQLSQLTALNLPDAASLSDTVAAIPTAREATGALSNAAVQIQRWIEKAVEVLGGLDAEDDVEWAAAGGRDGLGEVEVAIGKFEVLVKAYIAAIEDLQRRGDVDDVPKGELKGVLDTLDNIISSWANVGKLLREVRRQVELALEWEELWNKVLGEIGQELEELRKLVFELEEKRYASIPEDDEQTPSPTDPSMDIKDLETIVEETPLRASINSKAGGKHKNGRANDSISLPPPLPGSAAANSYDDSGLLTLYARMQPLRASLDFLPMKLSSFKVRAESVLPSACGELMTRKDELEDEYKKLESKADNLKQELSEDRWVHVFRTAGRQARKMCESVERGVEKVQEALESGTAPLSAGNATLMKKISDYEAKKANYGSAIRKIIAVIDKGIQDRKTINGEILSIQADIKSMWHQLEEELRETDAALEELHLRPKSSSSQQPMRDSISTILSNDVSMTDSVVDTPGSSPASSIVAATPAKKNYPATPDDSRNRRVSNGRAQPATRPTVNTRRTSTAAAGSAQSSLQKRLSYSSQLSYGAPSPSPSTASMRTFSQSSATKPHLRSGGAPVPIKERPRWNTGTRVNYNDYKPARRAPNPAPAAAAASTPGPSTPSNPHVRTLNGKRIYNTPSTYAAYFSENPNTPTAANKGTAAGVRSAAAANRISLPPQSLTSTPRLSAYAQPPRAASSMALRSRGRSVSTASPSPSPVPDSDRLVATDPRPRPRRYHPTAGAGSGGSGGATSGGGNPALLNTPAAGGKRASHLPVMGGGRGDGSPLGRRVGAAAMAARPATAMGSAGDEKGRRRVSLLPMPVGR